MITTIITFRRYFVQSHMGRVERFAITALTPVNSGIRRTLPLYFRCNVDCQTAHAFKLFLSLSCKSRNRSPRGASSQVPLPCFRVCPCLCVWSHFGGADFAHMLRHTFLLILCLVSTRLVSTRQVLGWVFATILLIGHLNSRVSNKLLYVNCM